METRSSLLDAYHSLSHKFDILGNVRSTYHTPVNFRETAGVPIHRWYFYKEGFSPSFVQDFMTSYSTEGSIVFDPFAGVGTTGLEAVKMGHDVFLMDVNPLCILACKVKTEFYNHNDIIFLKDQCNLLKGLKDHPITCEISNLTVKKYFLPETWNSLLKLRSFILGITDKKCNNLFLLVLLSLIDVISSYRKDGNGVKKKRNIPPSFSFIELVKIFVEKIGKYIDDLAETKLIGSSKVIPQSCINPYRLPSKVDVVLTSPPYANCFDYSKVYLSELWISGFFKQKDDQRAFRENSISSHVHHKWEPRNEVFKSNIVNYLILPLLAKQDLWSPNIIPMLSGYFCDMGRFFHNLSSNLNPNAKVGIVVGNSVYGGVPVATDLILAEQAESAGFRCLHIKPYRKIVASSQQMSLLNQTEKSLIRESLIMLQWGN